MLDADPAAFALTVQGIDSRLELVLGGKIFDVETGPGDDPVTLEAVRDDVNVQVTGYTSRAPVLFDISGPCLDVGDLDRWLARGRIRHGGGG